MNDVSLIEAWKIWLSGDLPANTVLWGIRLLWWERIGKLMQVVGATTIIADIIGPEEIRRFGSSLQSTVPSAALIQFLKQCFAWYSTTFRQTILKDFVDESADLKSAPNHFHLNVLNYLICLLLTLFVMYLAKLYAVGWGILILEFVIIFGCLLVSVAPIFTVLTVIGLTTAGLVVNSLLIKPLALILENPSLDRFIKIASLLFLLLGFHFELLAS